MIKIMYLVLAAAGLVLPYSAILSEYQSSGGFDFSLMLQAMWATPMSRIFAWDLTVAAVSWLAWAVHQFKSVRIWQFILCAAGTFLVGMSFGFPLFLFFREINRDSAPSSS